MGCGVTKEAEVAVNGSSDERKAEVFGRLITDDRNPLAVELSKYFQSLLTECKYRAQGSLEGYERMRESRKSTVVVTPTSKAAITHGIGKEPLTTQSVYNIVELFLGYAMLMLKRERWDGALNYRIEKVDPTTGSLSSAGPKSNDDQNRLVVTNSKRVAKNPVGVEGCLTVVSSVDYLTTDRVQKLHCDSQIRFDFIFLLEDVRIDP